MNEKNIKAILALLILFVALSILLIFVGNQNTLMAPNVFPMFMVLSTVGLGFLVGLLFLVNNSAPTKKTALRAKVSKKKRK